MAEDAPKPLPPKPVISLSGENVDELGRPRKTEEPESKPFTDAADPKQLEAKKKEAGQRRRADRDWYQLLLSTPARRDSFYRLLESCHIFGTYADLGSGNRLSDPYRTYHQAGEENVGKRMMAAAIDASPDLYLQMLKEQRAQRQAKERNDDN